MITVIIHILNEDPVVAEIDQLPAPEATNIKIQNPRLRDGKILHYLQSDVSEVIWPMHRINYIEILADIEQEEIITFVRE